MTQSNGTGAQCPEQHMGSSLGTLGVLALAWVLERGREREEMNYGIQAYLSSIQHQKLDLLKAEKRKKRRTTADGALD